MKVNKLALLFFLMTFIGCQTTKYKYYSSKFLQVDDNEVYRILEVAYEYYEENGPQNWQENVVIVRTDSINNYYQCRISFFEKAILAWYLADKKDELFGYLNYRGAPVLVYGKYCDNLFTKERGEKKLSFIKRVLKKDKLKISPIFEPNMWVYNLINGRLDLIAEGRYSILH